MHPLLTRTQLRTTPYKRPQIVRTLESLISHPEIREINATTKRLVDRCLSGDWCVQLRRVDSPTSGSGSDSGFPSFPTFKVERVDSMSGAESGPEFKPKEKVHVLKTSKSVENVRKVKHGSERIGGTSNGHTSTMNLQEMSNALPTAYSTPASPAGRNPPHRSSTFTEGSRDSETSLPSSVSSLDQLASASTPQTQSPIRRSSITRPQAHTRHSHNPSTSSSTSSNKDVFNGIDSLGQVVESIIAPAPLHSSQSYTHTHARKGSNSSNFSNSSPFGSSSSISINSDPGSPHQSQMKETQTKSRRAAPPAPPKRRKPPAIPTSKTAGGATMVTIASSATSYSGGSVGTSGAVSPTLPSSTSSHRMVPSPLSRAFS